MSGSWTDGPDSDGGGRRPGPSEAARVEGGQVVAAGSAAGSIYDLGYRGYTGARLGRRHAIASLGRQSFRQSWGVGRPGRAKVVPFGIAAMAAVPAVVALGVAALAKQLGAGDLMEQASPIKYETYYPLIGQVVFLFAAAQAPELLVRDQRHRVLALFFSRAIHREDYALAKLLALTAAMTLLVLVPQALVFTGRALLAPDILASVSSDAPLLPAIVGQAVLTAWLLASLSLAIASFTARRAYATVAIFAAVLVPVVAVAVIAELRGGDLARIASLLSPADVLDGTNAWLYGHPEAGPSGATLPSTAYLGAALVFTAVATIVLFVRYRVIEP